MNHVLALVSGESSGVPDCCGWTQVEQGWALTLTQAGQLKVGTFSPALCDCNLL